MTEWTRLNPIARTILQGVYDGDSPLSQLLGIPHVLQIIWNKIILYWKEHIKLVEDETYTGVMEPPAPKDGTLGFFALESICFPEPTNTNINMMPFVLDSQNEEYCLPDYLKPYLNLIRDVVDLIVFGDKAQQGQIGYLTIQESYVDENTSQRRPGIHTESPGVVCITDTSENVYEGDGTSKISDLPIWWGRGGYKSEYGFEGGIYMASTVENSCALWNCRILSDKDGNEIIGELGDIDHLRNFLPSSEVMKANCIYWLTDRTPHESLPLKKGTYRQFIRIVTCDVTIWYEDHSTKNPCGVVPNPKITKIVTGSKFDKGGVVLKK